MELKDTIEMMNSDDYGERLKAEYHQTKIRYDKLDEMTVKYEAGTLPFSPDCSLELLKEQKKHMGNYIRCLKIRAEIERISLNDDDNKSKSFRGFEEVVKDKKKFSTKTTLPVRSDPRSAGYDFYSKELVMIEPGEQYLFWTDVKAYMSNDEVLNVYVRSSIGIKKGLTLANTVGIIDSSYYSNPDNDGNIGICLKNTSNKTITIDIGERIAQGVFSKYLISDNDTTLKNERSGGIGSSGK